jgi:hypothetical protein
MLGVSASPYSPCLAAQLPAGGLVTSIVTGVLAHLQLGWAAAAVLVLSGGAMSDMESVYGALGIKAAWGELTAGQAL